MWTDPTQSADGVRLFDGHSFDRLAEVTTDRLRIIASHSSDMPAPCSEGTLRARNVPQKEVTREREREAKSGVSDTDAWTRLATAH